jgi:hypothetical protein
VVSDRQTVVVPQSAESESPKDMTPATLSRRRGRVWVAAVLACSLSFTAYELTRRARFHFTIEIAAPEPLSVRLFSGSGPGVEMSEPQSSAASWPRDGRFRKLEFLLPKAVIHEFRLGLDRAPGDLAFRNLAIRGQHGYVLPLSSSAVVCPESLQCRYEANGEVRITAAPGGHPAQLRVELSGPFSYVRAKAVEKIPVILIGNALLLGAAVCVYAARRPLLRLWNPARGWFRGADARLAALARRLSVPGFARFDAGALWFYLSCVAVFGTAAIWNLNGSSTGVYASWFRYGPGDGLLLGTPRGIRTDEFFHHTPTVLNQALRADRFARERTALGNHSVGLLSNIPIRHAAAVFRPQFWAFFVAPAEHAFSFFWQFKGFLLLTGVFTWLLLVTRNSFLSAAGALWYFFSPFTQWGYSWPSLLPEMVGLLCMVMVCVCFLAVGRHPLALVLAAAAGAGCTVNFVLCGYLPHLIPLAWLAVFFLTGWGVASRRFVFRREDRGRRATAILGAVLVAAIAGILVYADLREAMAALANTVYPGKRSLPGGMNLSLPALLSHFLQWTETEHHFPPAMSNICESAGFLWLAPVPLLCWRRLRFRKADLPLLAALWCALVFLVVFMVFPVPKEIGRLFGMDRTYSTRCLPAAGLANIAAVVLCLARGDRRKQAPEPRLAGGILGLAATFVLFLGLLVASNASLGWFFSWPEVLFSASLGALLIVLLLGRRAREFAVALLVPHILLFGATNPVQRGLPVITSSELAAFTRSDPGLLRGKWLVYSDSLAPAGFFVSAGLDVYGGLRHLPDIDHFGLFAARGLDVAVANRAGYLTAHLIGADERSRFQLVSIEVVQWHVAVSDPLLDQIGIRYVAFDQRPSAVDASRLIPLSDSPISTFWLYRRN